MELLHSSTRRSFLKQTSGVALTSSLAGAPALLAKRNPNDVIGVACIGVGTQGHRKLQDAQKVPDTEIRIICDLYDGNIKRAQKLCTNPKVRVIKEWEKAIQDPDIDVVIIATPDFWHAPMTIAAAQAKKDIYVEKGWCVNVQEAKAMRRAVKENKVIMQLGHHYNSLATYHRAREIFQSGALGKVPTVRTYIDRAGAAANWKFYSDYSILTPPADAAPATIDYDRFQAHAPKTQFDIDRFFTWRRYWDYGTGLAGDLMSHLWDGVNMIMGMGIPETMQAQGGIYFWKDGREVPDLWHTIMDYPSKDLCITFGAVTFNEHVGEITNIMGREQTLDVSPSFCRVYDAEWKPEHRQRLGKARELAPKLGLNARDAVVPPAYSLGDEAVVPTSHMQNLLDCARTRTVPRCAEDRAFEEAVTIAMSVESYRRNKKVRWDAATEQILDL